MIGGGNTAVEEALFLTNFATKVTVIHRRDAFRAEKILQNRLFANPKVEVIWDTVVEDVLGTTGTPPSVTGVKLRNVKTGAVARAARRRRLRGDRPCAVGRAGRRPAQDEADRLHLDRSRIRPRPAFPASSPPATSPTRSSARR